jgi:hypothetical protein
MKVAILLPGQPRFTAGFNKFLSNLKGYDSADWFVCMSETTDSHHQIKLLADNWNNFNKNWAYEKIESMLPENNCIRSFEISDDQQQVFPEVKNVKEVANVKYPFRMFYNIYKVDQARQRYEQLHNFTYDLVIRTRTDIGLGTELDLRNLTINENHIMMPSNEWHGDPRANDQFAIGKSSSMSVYASLYTRIKDYNDEGMTFHPESMVGHNLNKQGIHFDRGGFEAVIDRVPVE